MSPTVPRRSVRMWCDRQWAISIICAIVALVASVWLILFDRYLLGAMAEEAFTARWTQAE